VPLETTDILLGLNTGMIDAVPLPPLIALAGQVNRPAPHMLNFEWSPIVGAAVIRADLWEKIPAELRAKLAASAEATGEKIRALGRKEDEDAIAAMKQHGLQIDTPSPADDAAWQAVADDLSAKVRGTIVPAEIYDAALQNLRDYRAAHPAGANP
jgi:TRAP-type C4-dicarboxylate transport system substrate-binding protein